MSLAALDTHEVVKELQAAGFTDAQAEAVARNIRKAQDLDLSLWASRSRPAIAFRLPKLEPWKWAFLWTLTLQTILIVGGAYVLIKALRS